MSTTITYHKDSLEYVEYLTHGVSLAAIENFALQLAQQYSNAGIAEVTYTTGRVLTATEQSGDYASIELYAKVLLRDIDSGKLYGINIRAPKATMFEEVPEEGWRVKAAVGAAIANLYSLLSGRTFTFDQGKLCGRG